MAETETYTITFGDVAENHAGMQKLGSKATSGFSVSELEVAAAGLEADGVMCEIVRLNELLGEDSGSDSSEEEGAEEAAILVIRNGLAMFCDPAEFHAEQAALTKDTKAFMYGRVVNKHARHNLCFAEAAQVACVEEGRGTVVAFKDVPVLAAVRAALPDVLGEKARNLLAEGNYYFNKKTTGIGWHGDAERRRVIGCRTGATMRLAFQWFRRFKPVGSMCCLTLNHGDMYVMSDKAVGYDWKQSSKLTLRHAAGADKFLVLPS